jgi:hypothetical protein
MGDLGGSAFRENNGKLMALPINELISSNKAEEEDSPSLSKATVTKPICTNAINAVTAITNNTKWIGEKGEGMSASLNIKS